MNQNNQYPLEKKHLKCIQQPIIIFRWYSEEFFHNSFFIIIFNGNHTKLDNFLNAMSLGLCQNLYGWGYGKHKKLFTVGFAFSLGF